VPHALGGGRPGNWSESSAPNRFPSKPIYPSTPAVDQGKRIHAGGFAIDDFVFFGDFSFTFFGVILFSFSTSSAHIHLHYIWSAALGLIL